MQRENQALGIWVGLAMFILVGPSLATHIALILAGQWLAEDTPILLVSLVWWSASICLFILATYGHKTRIESTGQVKIRLGNLKLRTIDVKNFSRVLLVSLLDGFVVILMNETETGDWPGEFVYLAWTRRSARARAFAEGISFEFGLELVDVTTQSHIEDRLKDNLSSRESAARPARNIRELLLMHSVI